MFKLSIKKVLILFSFVFIMFSTFNLSTVKASSFTESDVSSEISELRTLNTKTFKVDEKTNKLVAHNANIHFRKGSTLQDIDNTLVKKGNNYVTKNSNYSITFPNKISEKNSISIFHVDSLLNIQYNDINKSKAKIENGLGNNNLEHTSSRITYKEINKDVDLSFDINTDSLKENIILHKYIPDYYFEFEIKLTNLYLVEDDDSNILIIDENNNVIYSIGQYFMLDNNENISYDIDVTYEKISSSKYIFKVIPNNQWLKDTERIYPITIDPTLILRNNSSNVFIEDKHCTVGSSSSTNTTYLSIMYDPTIAIPPQTEVVQFALIKLNVDAIKNSIAYSPFTIIDSIKLKLTAMSENLKAGVRVDEVLAPEEYSSMNGNTTYTTSYMCNLTKNNYVIDIKNRLTNHMDHDEDSFILKLSANYYSLNNSVRFYSSDYTTNSSYKPTIEIIYTNNLGAAYNHISCNNPLVNCYTYIIDRSVKKNPGMYSDPNFKLGPFQTTEAVAVHLERDFRYLGIGYRRLTNFNDYIYPNEIRIALKTGYHPNSIFDPFFDYHFIIQNSEGSWSSKPGASPSEILFSKHQNPSNEYWDHRVLRNEQGQIIVDVDYYNNKIIYYAIIP